MAAYEVVKYTHREYVKSKTKFIIISDSLSDLIANTNTLNPTDITKLIQEETFYDGKKENQVQFTRILRHIDIPGNEKVDNETPNAIVSLAASTINYTTSSDAKNVIYSHINCAPTGEILTSDSTK